MDKKEVAGLLRAAAVDLAVKPRAERELARLIMQEARAQAKVEGCSYREADQGANRVFERLQTYILAQKITDPEHIVNLAEFFVRGGYMRDQSGKPRWQPSIFKIMKREEKSAQRRMVSLQEPISYHRVYHDSNHWRP
jgi:hypothetical protein